MADEGFLGSKDDTLGRNTCSAHLGGIVDGRSREGEGEGSETFESHAVAIGEVLTDHLFDGGNCGVNISSIECASCGYGLYDLLERDGTFGHYSGVIHFGSLGIGVGVGIEFKRYSHNYDVLCCAALIRACGWYINNII